MLLTVRPHGIDRLRVSAKPAEASLRRAFLGVCQGGLSSETPSAPVPSLWPTVYLGTVDMVWGVRNTCALSVDVLDGCEVPGDQIWMAGWSWTGAKLHGGGCWRPQHDLQRPAAKDGLLQIKLLDLRPGCTYVLAVARCTGGTWHMGRAATLYSPDRDPAEPGTAVKQHKLATTPRDAGVKLHIEEMDCTLKKPAEEVELACASVYQHLEKVLGLQPKARAATPAEPPLTAVAAVMLPTDSHAHPSPVAEDVAEDAGCFFWGAPASADHASSTEASAAHSPSSSSTANLGRCASPSEAAFLTLPLTKRLRRRQAPAHRASKGTAVAQADVRPGPPLHRHARRNSRAVRAQRAAAAMFAAAVQKRSAAAAAHSRDAPLPALPVAVPTVQAQPPGGQSQAGAVPVTAARRRRMTALKQQAQHQQRLRRDRQAAIMQRLKGVLKKAMAVVGAAKLRDERRSPASRTSRREERRQRHLLRQAKAMPAKRQVLLCKLHVVLRELRQQRMRKAVRFLVMAGALSKSTAPAAKVVPPCANEAPAAAGAHVQCSTAALIGNSACQQKVPVFLEGHGPRVVHVALNCTVQQLVTSAGLRSSSFYLVHSGRVISKDPLVTLASLGLSEGSRVDVRLRVPGGMGCGASSSIQPVSSMDFPAAKGSASISGPSQVSRFALRGPAQVASFTWPSLTTRQPYKLPPLLVAYTPQFASANSEFVLPDLRVRVGYRWKPLTCSASIVIEPSVTSLRDSLSLFLELLVDLAKPAAPGVPHGFVMSQLQAYCKASMAEQHIPIASCAPITYTPDAEVGYRQVWDLLALVAHQDEGVLLVFARYLAGATGLHLVMGMMVSCDKFRGRTAFAMTARGQGLLQHLANSCRKSMLELLPPCTATSASTLWDMELSLQDYVDGFAAKGWFQLSAHGFVERTRPALPSLKRMVEAPRVWGLSVDRLCKWLGTDRAQLLGCHRVRYPAYPVEVLLLEQASKYTNRSNVDYWYRDGPDQLPAFPWPCFNNGISVIGLPERLREPAFFFTVDNTSDNNELADISAEGATAVASMQQLSAAAMAEGVQSSAPGLYVTLPGLQALLARLTREGRQALKVHLDPTSQQPQTLERPQWAASANALALTIERVLSAFLFIAHVPGSQAHLAQAPTTGTLRALQAFCALPAWTGGHHGYIANCVAASQVVPGLESLLIHVMATQHSPRPTATIVLTCVQSIEAAVQSAATQQPRALDYPAHYEALSAHYGVHGDGANRKIAKLLRDRTCLFESVLYTLIAKAELSPAAAAHAMEILITQERILRPSKEALPDLIASLDPWSTRLVMCVLVFGLATIRQSATTPPVGSSNLEFDGGTASCNRLCQALALTLSSGMRSPTEGPAMLAFSIVCPGEDPHVLEYLLQLVGNCLPPTSKDAVFIFTGPTGGCNDYTPTRCAHSDFAPRQMYTYACSSEVSSRAYWYFSEDDEDCQEMDSDTGEAKTAAVKSEPMSAEAAAMESNANARLSMDLNNLDDVTVAGVTWGEARQGDLLVLAILSRKRRHLEVLLKHGFEPNSRTGGAWHLGRSRIFNVGGDELLQRACMAMQQDPWARCSGMGFKPAVAWVRPVHIAAVLGDARSHTLLLGAGAKPDLWCLGTSDASQGHISQAKPLQWAFAATDLIVMLGGAHTVSATLMETPLTGCVTLSCGVVPLGAFFTVLNLASLGLSGKDLALLSEALMRAPALRTLQKLDLRDNDLASDIGGAADTSCQGLNALASYLKHTTTLWQLNVMGVWQECITSNTQLLIAAHSFAEECLASPSLVSLDSLRFQQPEPAPSAGPKHVATQQPPAHSTALLTPSLQKDHPELARIAALCLQCGSIQNAHLYGTSVLVSAQSHDGWLHLYASAGLSGVVAAAWLQSVTAATIVVHIPAIGLGTGFRGIWVELCKAVSANSRLLRFTLVFSLNSARVSAPFVALSDQKTTPSAASSLAHLIDGMAGMFGPFGTTGLVECNVFCSGVFSSEAATQASVSLAKVWRVLQAVPSLKIVNGHALGPRRHGFEPPSPFDTWLHVEIHQTDMHTSPSPVLTADRSASRLHLSQRTHTAPPRPATLVVLMRLGAQQSRLLVDSLDLPKLTAVFPYLHSSHLLSGWSVHPLPACAESLPNELLPGISVVDRAQQGQALMIDYLLVQRWAIEVVFKRLRNESHLSVAFSANEEAGELPVALSDDDNGTGSSASEAGHSDSASGNRRYATQAMKYLYGPLVALSRLEHLNISISHSLPLGPLAALIIHLWQHHPTLRMVNDVQRTSAPASAAGKLVTSPVVCVADNGESAMQQVLLLTWQIQGSASTMANLVRVSLAYPSNHYGSHGAGESWLDTVVLPYFDQPPGSFPVLECIEISGLKGCDEECGVLRMATILPAFRALQTMSVASAATVPAGFLQHELKLLAASACMLGLHTKSVKVALLHSGASVVWTSGRTGALPIERRTPRYVAQHCCWGSVESVQHPAASRFAPIPLRPLHPHLFLTSNCLRRLELSMCCDEENWQFLVRFAQHLPNLTLLQEVVLDFLGVTGTNWYRRRAPTDNNAWKFMCEALCVAINLPNIESVNGANVRALSGAQIVSVQLPALAPAAKAIVTYIMKADAGRGTHKEQIMTLEAGNASSAIITSLLVSHPEVQRVSVMDTSINSAGLVRCLCQMSKDPDVVCLQELQVAGDPYLAGSERENRDDSFVDLYTHVFQWPSLARLDMDAPHALLGERRSDGLVSLSKRLGVPLEILRKGNMEIIAFIKSLREGESRTFRCKLMLVGAGAVGKTTLAVRLMHNKWDDSIEYTDGLGVHEWELPIPTETNQNLTFSLWDFGGQDIYFSTHAFFMAKRAVYLCLWNSRQDSKSPYAVVHEYMTRIHAMAPDAPVLLVGTFAGENTPTPPPDDLYQDFPQIEKGVYFVSSKSGEGIPQLKAAILAVAMQQPGMGERLPSSYIKLRKEIILAHSLLPAGVAPYMDYKDYRELALSTCGITDEDELTRATTLLCDFGDISHFKAVPGLDTRIIMRPQWIAEVMAMVVTTEKSKLESLTGGRVKNTSLVAVMSRINADLAVALVRLMECFSLLYVIDDVFSLIPPLLTAGSSRDGAKLMKVLPGQTTWKSEYSFTFMPDGFLCRLLCRLFAWAGVTVTHAWKFGAVLEKNGQRCCLGRHVYHPNIIIVQVVGSQPQNLATLVSSKMQALREESFPGVQLHDVKICCTSCVEQKVGPGSFSLKLLFQQTDAGKIQVDCTTCGKPVLIEPMLLLDDQVVALTKERPVPSSHSGPVGAAHFIEESVVMRQMALFRDQITRQQATLDQMLVKQNEAAEEIARRVMALHRAVAASEDKATPYMSIVLPVPDASRKWHDIKGILKSSFNLHLMCEDQQHPHIADHPGYKIDRPKVWLRKIAPGLKIAATLAGMLLSQGIQAATSGATDLGAGNLGGLVDQYVLDEPFKAFEKLNEVLDTLLLEGPQESATTVKPDVHQQEQMDFRACQAARREVQALLVLLDPTCVFGNLYKTPTLSGDVLWLCKHHAAQHKGLLQEIEPPSSS